VRFTLTEDQLLFGQAVRDLLDKRCGPDLVRASWAPTLPDAARSLWTELAGLGTFGVLVPEGAGGLGLTELELVPILEEVGRAAVPLPVLEAVVAAPALALAEASADLAGLLQGEIVVTAGFADGALLPQAQIADVAVLFVTGSTRLIELSAGAISPEESVDRSRRLGRLRPAALAGATVVSADASAPERAFERAALGASAVLVGLSQHLIDVTVDYVKERRQFGVPIGSFQAIKHRLADAHVALQFAKPAVYQAAYSLANDRPTVARDVSLAKAMASDAGRVVAGAALQCHGAMGYADEYDLHLWFKRVWALAASYGDAAWHRNRIGQALGI
jgi:alkylation response protein AidB-like acyl-CoA dehydrogenase